MAKDDLDEDIGRSVLVDQHRLDEEWLAQPRIMRQASRRLADLKRDVAYAKANISVVEADVSLRVRQYPERYGLSAEKRPSEDTVKATVSLDSGVRKAHKEHADATHLYDLAKADVDAIVHRKAALEDLVVLWCRDYFSDPVCKDPRARQKFQEEQQDAPRWKGRVRGVKRESTDNE